MSDETTHGMSAGEEINARSLIMMALRERRKKTAHVFPLTEDEEARMEEFSLWFVTAYQVVATR